MPENTEPDWYIGSRPRSPEYTDADEFADAVKYLAPIVDPVIRHNTEPVEFGPGVFYPKDPTILDILDYAEKIAEINALPLVKGGFWNHATPRTAVIGLGGLLTSGKDAFADAVVEAFPETWTKIGMSDVLAESMYVLNPWIVDDTLSGRYADLVDNLGYTEVKRIPEVRRLLQAMGTEVGRDILGEDTWVSAIGKKIHEARSRGVSVLLTGVRFRNEINALKIMGGLSIWVERPGITKTTTHASENTLTAADFDRFLSNEGTLADLKATACHIAREALEAKNRF